MPDPDSLPPSQFPPEEDDGAFRVKVLLTGVAVLFVLIFVVIGVLVATRQ